MILEYIFTATNKSAMRIIAELITTRNKNMSAKFTLFLKTIALQLYVERVILF